MTAVAFAACSSPTPPAPTPAPDVEAPAAALRVVPAVSDLAIGPNRFAFGILDKASSPIRLAEARVAFVYLDSAPQETRARGTAKFIKWSAGAAGVYVVDVSFDRAGRWGVAVEVTEDDRDVGTAGVGFTVREESYSTGIGRPAPRSRNRTARDVSDLKEITTSPFPDPDLYEMTIADAVSSGRPTVVTFGTPAYCETATCGPQVEVVASLKDRHRADANFIHVEVYENPLEIEGDLSRGRLSPVLEEWGLRSEPFTFVLDKSGLVASKFEGFAAEEELEAALASVLGP